jgi:hypothetical protein
MSERPLQEAALALLLAAGQALQRLRRHDHDSEAVRTSLRESMEAVSNALAPSDRAAELTLDR